MENKIKVQDDRIIEQLVTGLSKKVGLTVTMKEDEYLVINYSQITLYSSENLFFVYTFLIGYVEGVRSEI